MPLELSVTGPGLQIKRLIDEGQSILIGRDTDTDLCLPDPKKTVSRQHLVAWVEAGQLQLRVLSVELRPWDAYTRYFADESSRMAQWVERLFNRYFTSAYRAASAYGLRGSCGAGCGSR